MQPILYLVAHARATSLLTGQRATLPFGEKMQKVRNLLLAVALVVLGASTADAQRWGAQISWGDESDIGVGVRGEWDFANKLTQQGAFSRAFIIGQVDYYFVDCPSGVSCTWLEINPSLAIPFTAAGSSVKPYAGAGLHLVYARQSAGGNSASDTELGLNILGGLKFDLGGMDAFSEARLGLGGDAEQLALSFGVMFGRTSASKAPAPRR